MWRTEDDSLPASMAFVRLGIAGRETAAEIAGIDSKHGTENGSAALRESAVSVLGSYAKSGDEESRELLRKYMNDADKNFSEEAKYWLTIASGSA